MILAWAAAAWACEPVAAQVEAARASFDDAEVDAARAAIAAAYASLLCQESVVETADLLALYRLDGLVSLATDDPQRAVYAVLRAVAADPVTGMSAEEEGPELFGMYRTWQARLAPALVQVTVDGPETVWVDGRPARATLPLRVAQGEHLVQSEGTSGLTSRIVEISSDWRAGDVPGLPAPVAPAPAPAPQPITVPVHTRRRDGVSTASWISGLVLGAAGGAGIGWAAWQEREFLSDPYADDAYGGCPRTAPCWPAARADAIREDEQRIRWTYLGGYGLTGLGGSLLVGGLAGAAIHTRF